MAIHQIGIDADTAILAGRFTCIVRLPPGFISGDILNWNGKDSPLKSRPVLLSRFGGAIAITASIGPKGIFCNASKLWLSADVDYGGDAMRIHQNQINPNAQLDAMYASQKAAAKQRAERTRKKLSEFASAIAGEADVESCVVRLGAREEPGAETKQNPQRWPRKQKQVRNSEEAQSSISDWA
jgi:hypothetical protein